jgi:hypothetical protein
MQGMFKLVPKQKKCMPLKCRRIAGSNGTSGDMKNDVILLRAECRKR